MSTSHGGNRPNSGRKPLPPHKRRLNIGFRLPPDVIDWIRTHGNQSRTVEDVIRSSASFRAWSRNQPGLNQHRQKG